MTESMWIHLFWVGGIVLSVAVPSLVLGVVSSNGSSLIESWIKSRGAIALKKLDHERACPRFNDTPRK